MNNFEKDFDELKKFNQKINLINKEVENLNLQLQEKCKDFVKNYTIQNPMKKIGSIEGLLKTGISAKQLMDLIQRSEKGESGILSLVPKLQNHMSAKKLANDILNYNLSVVADLESKFQSLDSIENKENLNNLIVSNNNTEYLIDLKVELALKLANNPKVKRCNDVNQFVYMVALNTIKKGGETILIYNYRAYNKIFLKLLYTYVALEQKFCLYNDKKGYIASDYFFIVDKQLKDKNPYISDLAVIKNSQFLNSSHLDINLLNNY